MSKPITLKEKYFTGYSLIDLGYRDYIAARFLLNNRFIIQGLTLASTAVEKYLKALIVLTSEEKEKYYYHFDNLEKLKAILAKSNSDVTEKFDPVFLNILENAFKIRYYDRIEKPIFIGFFINQFIGELDYTIDSLETFVLKTQKNETPYRRAIESKDPHLLENNFVLKKQNKKDFMEKPDDGFSIYISIGSSTQRENMVVGKGIVNKYEGSLSLFTEFQPKWSVQAYATTITSSSDKKHQA